MLSRVILPTNHLYNAIKLAVDTFGPLRGVIANSGVGGANFPGRTIDSILLFKQMSMERIHTASCRGTFDSRWYANTYGGDLIVLGSLWCSRIYRILCF